MHSWTNDISFWKKLGILQLEVAQESLKMLVNDWDWEPLYWESLCSVAMKKIAVIPC